MNINLIPLNTKGRVDFNSKVEFDRIDIPSVKALKDVFCEGYIIDNGTEEYEICLHITGEVILESAINGSDVKTDMDIKYEDFIPNLVEKYKNSANSLDILPIIWENILLEIPIRATNENDEFASVSGKGWEVLDEE